eukprot:tig00020703_g13123.t1
MLRISGYGSQVSHSDLLHFLNSNCQFSYVKGTYAFTPASTALGVASRREADALLSLTGKRCGGGELRVEEDYSEGAGMGDAMPAPSDNEIVSFVQSHYDPTSQFVSLAQLSNQPVFQGKNASLSRPHIAERFLAAIYKVCPQATTLDLSQNRISRLRTFGDSISRLAPAVVNISLQGNEISDFKEIESMSHLALREVWFADNPIASDATYRARVLRCFKSLQYLDGVEVGPDDAALSLPPTLGSYLDANSQAIVSAFIPRFFETYDSTNRQQLFNAYTENACFSVVVQTSVPGMQVAPSVQNRLRALITSSRNLLRLQEDGKRFSALRYTPLNIVQALTQLPSTAHNLQSLVVDSFVLDRVGPCPFLVVNVHGLFTETTTSDVFSFDRVFILVPPSNQQAAGAWPALILNESLTLRPKEDLAQPQAAGQPPSSLVATDQEALVQRLSSTTTAASDYCRQMLIAVGWNYDAALARLQQEMVQPLVAATGAPVDIVQQALIRTQGNFNQALQQIQSLKS